MERGDIMDSVALYNLAPGHDEWEAPAAVLFKRELRNPMLERQPPRGEPEFTPKMRRNGPFAVGDAVWIRPARPKCNKRRNPGMVTRIISSHNIEVDGMRRHRKDLKRKNGRMVSPGRTPCGAHTQGRRLPAGLVRR